MSRVRVSALVDAACIEHKARSVRLDSVTADLSTVQTQRDVCIGKLTMPKPVQQRSPWWLRAAFAGAIGAGGVALGAVAVGEGSPEMIIGVAVVEAGLIAVRLMLQWLDDRHVR